MMRSIFKAYTDGACSKNPGPGGWGWVYFLDNIRVMNWGGEKYTTNQKMELTAMIKLFEDLPSKSDVNVYSDSKYVLQGLVNGGEGLLGRQPNGWSKRWKEGGWKKPVKNNELWRELYNLCLTFKSREIGVYLEWVEGHSGDLGNDMADSLAKRGLREVTDSQKK